MRVSVRFIVWPNNKKRAVRRVTAMATSILIKCAEIACGTSLVGSRRSKLWWDPISCTPLHEAWNNAKNSGSADLDMLSKRWKKLKRKCKTAQRRKDRERVMKLFVGASGRHWKCFKELHQPRKTIDSVFSDSVGSKVVTEAAEKQEAFTKFYKNLATPAENPSFSKKPLEEAHTYLQNIDSSENAPLGSELDDEIVLAELKFARTKVYNNKAGGNDGLIGEMIKAGTESSDAFLLPLMQLCWEYEEIHDRLWREGTVVPIFKKGDPRDPGNYRGITLHSALGKFFVTIVARRINLFIEGKNLHEIPLISTKSEKR